VAFVCTVVGVKGLSVLQQVLLLCALAVGLVGMHHLSATTDMPASMPVVSAPVMAGTHADPAPSEDHSPSHELSHLCQAVLVAFGAALLGLSLLLRAFGAQLGVPRKMRASPPPERPPDRRGRVVLTCLCVLRV
jgi:hypothetical protein